MEPSMSDQQELDFRLIPDWVDVPAANDPRFVPARREPWNTLEAKRLLRFLLDRQGWRCARCGIHATVCERLQKDHVVALINGGDNTIHNQQMLCEPCHRLKTSADLELHRRLRPRLLG
jgi:5-methylcytosine-specific restriction endonuclease McrA